MALRNTNTFLLTVTLLGPGCSPQQSIDANSVTLDGGVDAFALADAPIPDGGIDAPDTFIPDAGIDAFEPPDARADASSDGGFITSIACPGWLGLPAGGVLLGGTNTSPEGLRVGPDCALYVASGNAVLRIEQGTGAITTFASSAMAADLQGLDFGPIV